MATPHRIPDVAKVEPGVLGGACESDRGRDCSQEEVMLARVFGDHVGLLRIGTGEVRRGGDLWAEKRGAVELQSVPSC